MFIVRGSLYIWWTVRISCKGSFQVLNSLNENLKFTVELGGKSLCFLDLKIANDDKKL